MGLFQKDWTTRNSFTFRKKTLEFYLKKMNKNPADKLFFTVIKILKQKNIKNWFQFYIFDFIFINIIIIIYCFVFVVVCFFPRLLCIFLLHITWLEIFDKIIEQFFFLFINCDIWVMQSPFEKYKKSIRDYKLNFPKAKLKFVTEFK